MEFRDFSGGINYEDAPENMKDNEFAGLTNVTYDEGGILRTRGGFVNCRHATILGTPHATWAGKIVYNGAYYINRIYPFLYSDGATEVPKILYTVGATMGAPRKGLWINDERLTDQITGDFDAAIYDNEIYVTTGTWQKRIENMSIKNIGHEAPPVPKISTGTWKSKTIETFETTGWQMCADPYDNGSVARDDTEHYEGSYSLRIKIDSNDGICVRKIIGTKDFSKFDDGSSSSEYDFISFKVKAWKQDQIKKIRIQFGWGATLNKWTSYYITDWLEAGKSYISKALKSQPALSQQLYKTSGIPMSNPQMEEDKISMVYLPSDWSEWTSVYIPKIDFIREGKAPESTYDWSNITKMRIWGVAAKIKDGDGYGGGDDACFWIDDMKLEGCGGSYGGLMGDFSFCAQYYNSRKNEYYEVSEETDSIQFWGNPIKIASIPKPFPDPAQIDTYLVWARPSNDDHWYLAYSQTRATPGTGVTSASVQISFSELLKRDELSERTGICPMPRLLGDGMIKGPNTTNNTPPPTANLLCHHKGMMFYVVGSKIYHSKPGAPYAVPEDNYIICPETVEAIQSDGSNLLIYTRFAEYVYMYAGEYQSNWVYMGYLVKSKTPLGCVARKTVSNGLFMSQRGLAYFDGVYSRILTHKIDNVYLPYPNKTQLCGVLWGDRYILALPPRTLWVFDRLDSDCRVVKWCFASHLPLFGGARVRINDICWHPFDGHLYVAMRPGLWRYNPDVNIDKNPCSGRSDGFPFSATSKIYYFANEIKKLPLERFMIDADADHTATKFIIEGPPYEWLVQSPVIRSRFYVDGELHGSMNSTLHSRRELEGFMDIGAVGSRFRYKISATLHDFYPNKPIRIYKIEVN